MSAESISPPIRAVLFDIGNVLLKFDFGLAMAKTAALSEVRDSLDVLARIERVKIAYEDGQIDRAAFLRAAIDALRYRGSEAEFISAWEDIFEPNEPMIALVEQLHTHVPLYLLSNTSDVHRDYVFRQYPFFARFAGGVYSYEARASKPGRAIFEIACRDLRLEAASTFFIDDLLPNIDTARSLGFQVHHYHFDEHSKLLAEPALAAVIAAAKAARG
ncbi:MAG TPA: HAD family phosphatase [Chthoniobacteraceae bacterium]|jgi:HAD superfamily hydrolase (TIGR01509 family)|nr:HAD-superfamily hydrolase, subfamily variant 3 [Chthoniobacter sp.]HEV7867107.1 HAD family phosphatase [Chthoniobacteraceae bacterium]